jgi:hypothetical protein
MFAFCAIGKFDETVSSATGLTNIVSFSANMNGRFDISFYAPDWTYLGKVCSSDAGLNCTADSAQICYPTRYTHIGFTCPNNQTIGLIDGSCVVMNTPGYKACMYLNRTYTTVSPIGVLLTNETISACPNRWTAQCLFQDQIQPISFSTSKC